MLAEQWFERQRTRNNERNRDETPAAPRCFTLFRRLGHLTDAQAAKIVAKELARPQWSVCDWRAYFDEQAAIAEYDRGLSRVDAEHQAFLICIRRFLERHPPGYRPDLNCLYCGDMVIKAESQPIRCADNLQRWVHHRCIPAFRLLRIHDAVVCLNRLGIRAPEHLDTPKGV